MNRMTMNTIVSTQIVTSTTGITSKRVLSIIFENNYASDRPISRVIPNLEESTILRRRMGFDARSVPMQAKRNIVGNTSAIRTHNIRNDGGRVGIGTDSKINDNRNRKAQK